MRIAQVSTLSAPVRRDSAGSIESFVWLLTRELNRLGHEVTVFGVAGSEVDGAFVETMPGPYAQDGAMEDWHLCEWVNLARALSVSGRFHVVHSHAYLWGLPLGPLARAPLVHTTHIVPDDDAARLRRMCPGAFVTAISRAQWSAYPDVAPAKVIPHGVDVSQFTLREKPGDYVLYLGRFVSGKGPLHAIQAARALGLRLVLAGPSNPYFREKVQPLVDGKSVAYAGFVRGAERDRLLGGARVLLYPIQHPEAFGLVLVEAMLCGTPVAAVRLGAVPEIVEDGVSGCLCDGMAGLPDAVTRCLALDRRRIREWAEPRFSAERMARDYAEYYAWVIGKS